MTRAVIAESVERVRSTRSFGGTDDTDLGGIPADWNVARLDTLATLASGGTPSKKRPDWWQGPIPWASPKDMKRPRLSDTEDHISEEALRSSSRLVPAGTIFVVIRGMILAKDLPVAMTEVPMAFNQDMKAILPGHRVDPEYLLYALASRKRALAREISTSAHGTRRMETASLESLLMPVPPPPEQRAIAAVLAKIQAAVEVQDKLVATLKELKAATMAKLFREGLRGEPLKQTEIGEIPESWEVVRLGDLLRLKSGESRPSELSARATRNNPFPVYGGNGVMGYTNRYLVATESIIIGRVGVYCGSVHVCPPRSWVTDNALFHPEPVDDRVSLWFLAELLARLRLNRLRRTGAQPLVTQGTVQTVRMGLPAKNEQEEMARTAILLRARIEAAQRRFASLQSLFSSMLHLLMTGQVRVNQLDHAEV
jgi:type I restriction enzyme S subunit